MLVRGDHAELNGQPVEGENNEGGEGCLVRIVASVHHTLIAGHLMDRRDLQRAAIHHGGHAGRACHGVVVVPIIQVPAAQEEGNEEEERGGAGHRPKGGEDPLNGALRARKDRSLLLEIQLVKVEVRAVQIHLETGDLVVARRTGR